MSQLTSTPSDIAYEGFGALLRLRIADLTQESYESIFRTDADGDELFRAFLDNLPDNRQHYNCQNCKRFLERYGTLGWVHADGQLQPLLWYDGVWPEFFAASAAAMGDLVRRAKVTGVFINDQKTWGNPKTGDWSHLSGSPGKVYESKTKTASQVEAEKGQDFIILKHGLSDYPVDVVKQAVRVLDADALDRSEKTLGNAKWLLALHESIADLKGPRRDNLVWSAVAKAPPGWCHVRSTMISTLLDDIKSGMSFDTISERWAKKMHPLQYQRPTAPLSAGQVQAANKKVEQLQAAGALERRFAKLEEVVSIWKPSVIPVKLERREGGIFDHLLPKREVKGVELPCTTMTWVRFWAEVLPTAKSIDFQVIVHGAYYGLVTAVNPDAPPILQWDTVPRNPVSWYFWVNGSPATQWSLKAHDWVKVNAICRNPPQWHHPEMFTHQGEAVLLVLEGAKPSAEMKGGSFFPETLRSEFHEIRAAMEAFSNNAVIQGREGGTANGYALQKDAPLNVLLRVDGDRTYRIDRWH